MHNKLSLYKLFLIATTRLNRAANFEAKRAEGLPDYHDGYHIEFL